jgi:hypothetical protein
MTTTEQSLTEIQRSQIEHSFAYIQRGWSLVMMPMRTKGPNHPGWNSPGELVNTPERAIQKFTHGPQNMGLVHNASGTGALDVDDEAWARHIFDEFGLDYDEILDWGLRIRSKPNRDKAIFAGVPEDLPLLKVTWPKHDAKSPVDRFTIIEFRAGPNQDVLPPSQHPDGHNYTWAEGRAPWDVEELPEIPPRLLDFWRALGDRSSGLREEIENLCPWKKMHSGKRYVQAGRSTSSADHNNVIGAYNRAASIEELLTQAGYKRKGKRWLCPASSTKIPGVVVFSDQEHQKCYSHHGSDPIADGYAHDAFDLLCMLQHNGDIKSALDDAARLVGIERHAPRLVPEVVLDLGAAMEAQERRKAAKAAPEVAATKADQVQAEPAKKGQAASEEMAYDVPDYPAHLLKPRGIVGGIMDWILQTAQKPQPILALAAALSVVGVALGRKVATSTGLRTNYYLVGVAGTSAGKDHARKCIKVLLQSAGLSDLLGGEEIASGPALLARAAAHPASLFQVDEFGLLLKAVGGKNSGPHLVSIITNFMKLFSSAGTIYNGTEYADRKTKERIDIAYPCICLHGTTTPETLWPALQSQDVVSGYLNRMIMMFVPDRRVAKQYVGIGNPPADLVDWLKAARELSNGIQGLDPANPIEVPFKGMTPQLFRSWDEWVENHMEEVKAKGLAPLWGRAWEHAAKIALGLSCARYSAADLKQVASGGGLEIDQTSAQWAIDFVRFTLMVQEEQVAARMGDSDFDRQAQETLRIVRNASTRGRTHAELVEASRMFRALEPRQQDAVMDSLKRREAIQLVQYKPPSGRGKSRMAWVASEFVTEQPDEGGGEQTGQKQD